MLIKIIVFLEFFVDFGSVFGLFATRLFEFVA
jgi:hypothetical protein